MTLSPSADAETVYGDGVYGSWLSANVEFDFRYYQNNTVNYISPYLQREVLGEGIEGHPLTSAQAIEIGEHFLRQLTDEPFALCAIGATSGFVYDPKINATKEGTEESYALAFTRIAEDVPLLFVNHQDMSSASYRTDLYTPPVGYEQIVMAIDREGRITNFAWMNPYALGAAQSPQSLIAQALLDDPSLLILDEPMNGLDKNGVRDIRELLLTLKGQGKTILLASHFAQDIDELCDSVYEMDQGMLTMLRDARPMG